MSAVTLDRADEAVRIDEAHDQFGDLHPAEQGAEAALGVAGRVDLDRYEAAARAVRQPAAALGMHADRSPGLERGPGSPADAGARHVDLEVGHPEPEFAGVDLDPPSGRAPAEQGVGPGGDGAHVVIADREPERLPGRIAAPGCLELP